MDNETRALEPLVILMAEDDPDDALLATEALEESRLINTLKVVENGADALDYLYQRGAYADPGSAPRPGVVLLDLNMPRMDGREVLRLMKEDKELRRIPVVVLTTSKAEEDVLRSYDLGASGYITKPVTFEGLVEVMRVLGDYWFQVVKLPS